MICRKRPAIVVPRPRPISLRDDATALWRKRRGNPFARIFIPVTARSVLTIAWRERLQPTPRKLSGLHQRFGEQFGHVFWPEIR